MTEAIDFVKTDLMPDFDFDAFNHDNAESYPDNTHADVKKEEYTDVAKTGTEEKKPEDKIDEGPTGIAAAATPEIDIKPDADEEVDKW